MKRLLILTLAVLVISPAAAMAFGGKPSPPGQPSSGPGSTANYICQGYTEYVAGSASAGERVWWYVPDTLKNGSSAPVVIFLHGFMLLAPDIYAGHIEHLARQGYIIIYPQFNKGGVGGILDDMMLNANQYDFLDRAVDAVDLALSRLGSKADRSRMTLYGHSVGGLLGLCWAGAGGAPVNRLVLASPCLSASAGMPDFVAGLVPITELDFSSLGPHTTAPVTILWGDDDTLADWSQQMDAVAALPNAASVRVYVLHTDDHGDPELTADHMASIQDDGWMPSWMMGLMGGDGEEDATDFRYFYAGLDQALAGAVDMAFDMGSWSDGRAVKPVTRGY